MRRCLKRAGELEEGAFGEVAERRTRRLLCGRCETVLAEVTKTVQIGGAVDHACTNPAGITFDIRCYRAARLITPDAPCAEHSWFAGYAWQIGTCPQCAAHLGWRFTGPERPAFAGLIRARVVERDA